MIKLLLQPPQGTCKPKKTKFWKGRERRLLESSPHADADDDTDTHHNIALYFLLWETTVHCSFLLIACVACSC